MAKPVSKEKTLMILKCLVEGNSIRSTERISGVCRNYIMKLIHAVGNACHAYLDARLVNLPLEHVEADEIWTFVGKKDKMLTATEKRSPELGSQYLFLGLDQSTKLIASYRLGKRNDFNTREFVDDLGDRLHRSPDTTSVARPQISTDGWGSYQPAIADTFGGQVRHGVLVKQYVNPEVGRYAPPDLCKAERIGINGIDDVTTICTSHIERHNLTIRLFMRRFTRLSLGFSKKLEALKAAVSLQVMHYNFCWRLRQKGNSGKLTPTPAEQAGLSDHQWSIEELYNTVMEHQEYLKLLERAAKMRRKLGLD